MSLVVLNAEEGSADYNAYDLGSGIWRKQAEDRKPLPAPTLWSWQKHLSAKPFEISSGWITRAGMTPAILIPTVYL